MICFLDTETTGLADDCNVWEIGLIHRDADGVDTEYCWLIRPDLTTAEPTGLRIGRYYERIGADLVAGPIGSARRIDGSGSVVYTSASTIAAQVARLLDGATIVGAVPDFDARHLGRWLRQYGQAGTWHYHLCDVETLAAGRLRLAPPWNFDGLLAAFGLTYDEAARHTALGDARMVRDLFDAVLTKDAAR